MIVLCFVVLQILFNAQSGLSPSLIRLKRSEQHFDLIGYMFTSVALDGGVHDLSFSIPERKEVFFLHWAGVTAAEAA